MKFFKEAQKLRELEWACLDWILVPTHSQMWIKKIAKIFFFNFLKISKLFKINKLLSLMNKMLNFLKNEHTEFLCIYVLHFTHVGSIGHKGLGIGGQMLGSYKGREVGSTSSSSQF